MVGTVTSVFIHPLVGKLVEAGEVAGEVCDRFTEPELQ